MEERRSTDKRMDKLEATVEKMQGDIVYIKTRIDNGFSTSIQSTENKVTYIDEANRKEHNDIRIAIKELSKKLDNLLWKLIGVTFFAMLVSTFGRIMGWL